jgi:hypothetical protein
MSGTIEPSDRMTQWPALEPAQSVVFPSYQWMIARIEAADSRLHTLMSFVATVTLGLPTLGRALNSSLSFRSLWFITGSLLASIIVVLGIVARGRGGIMLPNPMSLYNTSLNLSAEDFRIDALYFAGKHFETNRHTVEWKNRVLWWMSSFFLVEIALLFGWIVTS